MTDTPTPGATALTEAATRRVARQHVGETAIAAAADRLRHFRSTEPMRDSNFHANRLADALETILARLRAGNDISCGCVGQAWGQGNG